MAFCFESQALNRRQENADTSVFGVRHRGDSAPTRQRAGTAGRGLLKLQATVAIACLLSSSFPLPAAAQQTAPPAAATGLPSEPQPNYTQPLAMRSGVEDYSKPNPAFPNVFKIYQSVTVDPPVLTNSGNLADLIRDGKIYLSLSDAIVLGAQEQLRHRDSAL